MPLVALLYAVVQCNDHAVKIREQLQNSPLTLLATRVDVLSRTRYTVQGRKHKNSERGGRGNYDESAVQAPPSPPLPLNEKFKFVEMLLTAFWEHL